VTRKLTVIRKNKQVRRKMLVRRLVTLVLFFGTFMGAGMLTYANRLERLRAAEERLARYQEQYQWILDMNAYYQTQITMLEDDEFVAMLARERFFKSLPGEIIFRTSTDSESRWENDTTVSQTESPDGQPALLDLDESAVYEHHED